MVYYHFLFILVNIHLNVRALLTLKSKKVFSESSRPNGLKMTHLVIFEQISVIRKHYTLKVLRWGS